MSCKSQAKGGSFGLVDAHPLYTSFGNPCSGNYVVYRMRNLVGN